MGMRYEGPEAKRKRIEAERYREQLGKEPPLPPEEYLWQWEYRGTPEEKERLRAELLGEEVEPEQITQDEVLF